MIRRVQKSRIKTHYSRLNAGVHLSRSVAVRMEDYEVYYKKQKADSNCGFAEEFEVKNNLLIIYKLIIHSG